MNTAKPNRGGRPRSTRRALALSHAPYYIASFDRLKTVAFGREQVLPGRFDITVYQAGVKPERWEAKPNLGRLANPWRAGTAAALMAIVELSFGQKMSEWVKVDPPRGLQGPTMAPIDSEMLEAIALEHGRTAYRDTIQEKGL